MENYYNPSNADINHGTISKQSLPSLNNVRKQCEYDLDGPNEMNATTNMHTWQRNIISNAPPIEQDSFINSPHFNTTDIPNFQPPSSLSSVGLNPYMNPNVTNTYYNAADVLTSQNQNFRQDCLPNSFSPRFYENIYQNVDEGNSANKYDWNNNMVMSQKNIRTAANTMNRAINNTAHGANEMNIRESATHLIPIMNNGVLSHTMNNHTMNDNSINHNIRNNHGMNNLSMADHCMNNLNMNNISIKNQKGNPYTCKGGENASINGSNNSKNIGMSMNTNTNMSMSGMGMHRPSTSFAFNSTNSPYEMGQTSNADFLNDIEPLQGKCEYQQRNDLYENNKIQMMHHLNSPHKKIKKEKPISALQSAVYEAIIKAQLKNEEIPLMSSNNETEIIVEKSPYHVAICLEKLDEIVFPCGNINSVKYAVNVYFNAYDDIINKYQSKFYRCYYDPSETHVSCDLLNEIIVLPYNNEPFIYLKVSEISEYKTETIGRLQLKVKELPQELPLRIAIKGDDGSQKGYLLMNFFLINTTTDENVIPLKYKKKNTSKPEGATLKKKGMGFHFFENFTRWCCDIPYDPMD